tara:strand:+ start:6908 stop:7228 length:321 start_codon:yes stop_codon:yes gene_type:complete
MFTVSDYYIYIIIFLLLLSTVSIYFCIKFALLILKMQESIENSLDVIDQKYNNISKILEIPIFFDSPEIKRVLRELEDARSSLVYVANELTNSNIEDDVKTYDNEE